MSPTHFSSLRDGKGQPWVGGHPEGAERSQWGVLIEENLWAGSSDVLVLWDPTWALPGSNLSFLLVEWLVGPSGPRKFYNSQQLATPVSLVPQLLQK